MFSAKCFERTGTGLAVFLLATSMAQARETPQINMGPVCGAVTPTSAVVVVRMTDHGAKAALVVSTHETLMPRETGPTVPVTDSHDHVAKLPSPPLQPGTLYYYGVEVSGQILEGSRGRFRTFPAQGPSTFSFAFGNSLREDSTNSALYAAARRQPLFFLNTGDLFYRDIAIDDPDVFRDAYMKAFNAKAQAELYRSVPLAYIWDDHDFGPNDSDASAPGRKASWRVYREYVPHYPLPLGDSAPIAQAFTVGRVRFILSDLRSAREYNRLADGPEKTMMGRDQLAWFKKELETSAHSHGLIVWVSSVPWIERERRRGDAWGAYVTERRAIANFIKERGITNICILAGDAHVVAADDGTNSDYADGGGAPMPLMIAAPLDNPFTEVKGGPYSAGVYRCTPGENIYGWIEIRDSGDKIDVGFTAFNQHDEPRMTLTFKTK